MYFFSEIELKTSPQATYELPLSSYQKVARTSYHQFEQTRGEKLHNNGVEFREDESTE